jgi:hypothetical protein
VLTQEEKQRILGEEQKRIAEEKYRQEVRASLRSPARESTSCSEIREPNQTERKHGISNGFKLALVVLALVVWGVLHTAQTERGSTDGHSGPVLRNPIVRWQPVTEPIVEGPQTIPARSYRTWTIRVPNDVRNFRLTGHFAALGGGGSDIEAAVATEEEFQNWIHGHPARTAYSSPGKVTTGSIDVTLPPGTYILTFNNQFSVFTGKSVWAEVKATYEKQQ